MAVLRLMDGYHGADPQSAIVTPGQNEKHCLAGALHTSTGQLVWGEHFHKTTAVRRWLAENPKFELRFQPIYHPWVNQIERLCKAMQDTVIRNHQCRTLTELCPHVERFLDVVQPFPANGHGVAELGSAI